MGVTYSVRERNQNKKNQLENFNVRDLVVEWD
jgi:hypothetical protein